MITKTDYLLYKQCKKSFWIKKNQPSLFEKNENDRKVDKGNEVTEIARTLFPNGKLVPYSKDVELMVEITKRFIKEGIKTIYEAAFVHDGVLVVCDILNYTDQGWCLYEVKSSTSVKERHLDDIAIQHYVVNHCLSLYTSELIHINKEYVREDELNIYGLFNRCDVTKEVSDKMNIIEKEIEEMKELLKEGNVELDIGTHCTKYGKDEFICELKTRCWSHIPNYSVFNISRIGKKAFELYREGIVDIKDIPKKYKLSDTQKFQVEAYQENKEIIDKDEIKKFLSTFSQPIYFLDFETFQQTIPLFKGVRPFQQIPFQYSLHILKEDREKLEHKEFLGKEGEDPRRPLAEQIVKDIPMNVCVVAYNMSFEKMVLKELSELFSDLAEHLMNIHNQMIDLMVPFQKKYFYLNEMKGSYSIKYVLPALFPHDDELNYQRLSIQNGSMAMEIYERLHTFPCEEIEKIRRDLLDYCFLDTYAMVKIWLFLDELIHQTSLAK